MRFSWATDGLGGFVICHQDTENLYRFPYGIFSPINGASKWDLIEILEAQNQASPVRAKDQK